MEEKPLAEDMGYKNGYNINNDIQIKRVFTNKEETIIND